VVTGVTLVRLPDVERRSFVETTHVNFAQIPEEEITRYLATGEPFDKAGSYAIQGRAGRYVPRIEGCYFNIVGLPLARLWQELRELGWAEDLDMTVLE
jgi:septum formation protein